MKPFETTDCDTLYGLRQSSNYSKVIGAYRFHFEYLKRAIFEEDISCHHPLNQGTKMEDTGEMILHNHCEPIESWSPAASAATAAATAAVTAVAAVQQFSSYHHSNNFEWLGPQRASSCFSTHSSLLVNSFQSVYSFSDQLNKISILIINIEI